MKRISTHSWASAMFCLLTLFSTGCMYNVTGPRSYFRAPNAPAPLGTLTDPIWQQQEDNSEPEKFVVYQHEWTLNTVRLNEFGEDHVKQLAARLTAGQNFPVLVERSNTAVDQRTEYKYPVHDSPELDMRRRDVIVQALLAMGVADANQRVIIGMSMTRGYSDMEAERAYYRGFIGNGFNGAFGGFGGFGGMGGLGGFR